jgi:hypothetical protein
MNELDDTNLRWQIDHCLSASTEWDMLTLRSPQLGSTGEKLNGHAARRFIPGRLERSAPVIFIYRTLQYVEKD